MSNLFHLLDPEGGNDIDEEALAKVRGTKRVESEDLESIALQPASFSAARKNLKGLHAASAEEMTTLKDLSEMSEALTGVEESRKEQSSEISWDMKALYESAVPKKQRFNPLLQTTLENHEKKVSALEFAVQKTLAATAKASLTNRLGKEGKVPQKGGNSRRARRKQAKRERGAQIADRQRHGKVARKRRRKANRRAAPY